MGFGNGQGQDRLAARATSALPGTVLLAPGGAGPPQLLTAKPASHGGGGQPRNQDRIAEAAYPAIVYDPDRLVQFQVLLIPPPPTLTHQREIAPPLWRLPPGG